MSAIKLIYVSSHSEMKECETRLIEALHNSGETQLKDLGLGGNDLWWKDQSVKELLLDFMHN